MRTAGFAFLATLAAASQSVQDPELSGAAFTADDNCAGGAGDEACELSLRQLRGYKVVSTDPEWYPADDGWYPEEYPEEDPVPSAPTEPAGKPAPSPPPATDGEPAAPPATDGEPAAPPATEGKPDPPATGNATKPAPKKAEPKPQAPMYLDSSFSEGDDGSTDASCKISPFEVSPNKLYSAFSEKDGAGAAWKSSSVVLSVDTNQKRFEWEEDVDPAGSVSLRLTLNYTANKQKTMIRVGTINSHLTPLQNVHSATCLQPHCRLAKPMCGEEACSPESPECGFVKLKAFVEKPLAQVLTFNLTGVLSERNTSVQVFAVPVGLDEEGAWETPEISVDTWHFISLAKPGDAADDEIDSLDE
eukprot:CAMPEP_0171184216 /NCGR_PEP_ID=MMETSP0790-20130122/15675_1 /TAXON_ID=2925 /ORGANISM="Alexandrium catenella, Strain OF101" /LENGTH=359 /DNA_ID=CAMNT_0011649207 /DNA_START=68 /DNA_END=1147 /DNA_ORIENTATION=+